MKLKELLLNPKVELVKAGYCECGDMKFDVWLDGLWYSIVHLETIRKVLPDFTVEVKE